MGKRNRNTRMRQLLTNIFKKYGPLTAHRIVEACKKEGHKYYPSMTQLNNLKAWGFKEVARIEHNNYSIVDRYGIGHSMHSISGGTYMITVWGLPEQVGEDYEL